MESLKLILLVYLLSVSCHAQAPTIRHLSAKLNRLHRQTNMLQEDIDDIWNVLSDAASNSPNADTNQTTLDNSSTNEMFQLLNASIGNMNGLKLEVKQLVKYARNGLRNEKAHIRDAMVKLTNSQNELQSKTTKEIADFTILLHMQRQLIDELTVKVEGNKEQQHIIHNLTQDHKDELEENKAEIKVCNDKLTSVEQVLDGVIQELKGVEQVADGNKKLISSEKNRINQILLQVAECDVGWVRFLNHCYFFSSEATTWDKAMEFCQNNNGSLLEIDIDVEVQFILDIPTAANRFWLGANDRSEEGQVTWQSSKRPVLPHLWYKNEPNNGGNNEDCVEIYKHHEGKLNDNTCSRTLNFVCEKNIRYKLS